MSVILKGIDLPKETKEVCVMYRGKDGYLQSYIVKDIIQIPKGARLIDANEVKNDMMNAMCMTGYQSRAMDVIEFAPTILESEEEE